MQELYKDSDEALIVHNRVRSLLRVKCISGLVTLVCGLTALGGMGAVALVLADYVAVLPGIVRVVGGLSLAAGVVALAGLWMSRLVRRTRKRAVARDMEGWNPELRNYLSTAVDYLEGDATPAEGLGTEMVELLCRVVSPIAARATNGYVRPARRAALLCLLSATLVVMTLLLPFASAAWARMLSPMHAAPYSRVTVTPESADIYAGDTLTLTASFSGRPVERPALRYQYEGEWLDAPLTASGKGRFKGELSGLTADSMFEVSHRYAGTARGSVHVLIAPDVREWQVDVIPPSYTGQPVSTVTRGSLAVLEGSLLTFKIVPTTPLASGAFLLEDGSRLPLAEIGKRTWTCEYRATATTRYSLDLVSVSGLRSADDVSYGITVLYDREPEVEISDPAEDTTAPPGRKFPLTLRAGDDFGISELRLRVSLGRGDDLLLPLETTTGTPHQVSADVQLPIDEWGLEEGDILICYAEAVDTKAPDPGLGISTPRLIQIQQERPPGDDEGAAQEGGGSGGQMERVDLVKNQRSVCDAIRKLGHRSKEYQYKDTVVKQRRNREYTEALLEAVATMLPAPGLSAVEEAVREMYGVEAALDRRMRDDAAQAGMRALLSLYNAARYIPEMAPPPPGESEPGESPVMLVLEKLIEEEKRQQAKDKDEARESLRELEEALDAQESLNQQQGEQQDPQQGQPQQGEQQGQQTQASMARQQASLADMLEAIAERWDAAAEENAEVTHAVGEELRDSASEMDASAASAAKGDHDAALEHGQGAAEHLVEAIDALRTIAGIPPPAEGQPDEAYPAEFESEITEYFKRLTREQ